MKTTRVVFIASLVGLSLIVRPTPGADYHFSPGWAVGMAWVMESPRTVPVYDPFNETQRQVDGGHFYTRFEVTALERGPQGGVVNIEIRYKINNEFTYEGMGDVYVLAIDLRDGRVRSIERRRLKSDGTLWKQDRYVWPRETAGSGIPFQWPFGPNSLPPLLDFIWPVLSPGGSLTEFVLTSRSRDDEANKYNQTVTPFDGGARVTISYPWGTYPVKLVFRDGAPWYETEDLDGRVVARIVEVHTP